MMGVADWFSSPLAFPLARERKKKRGKCNLSNGVQYMRSLLRYSLTFACPVGQIPGIGSSASQGVLVLANIFFWLFAFRTRGVGAKLHITSCISAYLSINLRRTAHQTKLIEEMDGGEQGRGRRGEGEREGGNRRAWPRRGPMEPR